jgi:hypothetical protein
MFGLLKRKRPNFRQQLDVIATLTEPIKFHIYLELFPVYEKEMNSELASVLAVQVVHHLMGDDFKKVYDNCAPDVQKKIDAIKGLIEVKCDEAMTSNKVIRELIIRFLMTTFIIYHCLFDKAFFERAEMRNREDLIRKYDNVDPNDIPEAENFDRLIAFVKSFLEKSQQFLNTNNL